MGFSRQEYWSGEPLPSPCAYLCCHKWKDFLLFKGWICSIICILLWFFFKFALVKWSIRWADVQQQTRREIEIEVYYSQVLEVFGKPRGTTKKAMAPHSSTLAWKIPWTEEPGRLQTMGSQRVGHDWVTSLTFPFHALKRDMATHSSVLACRIIGTGEPGGPPSMGSHRVGHDWSDLAAAAAEVAMQL